MQSMEHAAKATTSRCSNGDLTLDRDTECSGGKRSFLAVTAKWSQPPRRPPVRNLPAKVGGQFAGQHHATDESNEFTLEYE